ncbi:MAG: SRPBCC family protein [Acidimicrobiales bacterium]
MTTPSISLDRTFATTADRMWEMWTVPEHFAAWYGPQGATIPVAEIDLTVGGTRRVCMQMDTPNGQMQMWFIGEHTTIDPTTTLSYTESMSDPDGRILTAEEMGMPGGDMPTTTEVTVTITPADDGVHVSLVHAGVPAGSPGEQGWAMALEKLAAAIA